MNRATLHPLLAIVVLLFATTVLVISLVSASMSKVSLRTGPTSSRVIRFSNVIVPGHILYPFTVLRDKVVLSFMNTADQCKEMLDLAGERLVQTKQLLELKDTQTALETMVKGQQYIREAVFQCQENKLTLQYRQDILKTIEQYHQQLQLMKPLYQDNDRAVVDQLLTENGALAQQLGFNE